MLTYSTHILQSDVVLSHVKPLLQYVHGTIFGRLNLVWFPILT